MEDWRHTLHHPAAGDHIAQVFRDEEFLAEAVVEYAGTGLRNGEAVIVIAAPQRWAAFKRRLEGAGVSPESAMALGQLVVLDAEATLAKLMRDGALDWTDFEKVVGKVIGVLRRQFGTVRAYGEMVDRLWQAGRRDEAIRLEEFWNELGRQHGFALLCAYQIDNLDPGSYGGPLECVCKLHTHLIPARDYARFDAMVGSASRTVLEAPLDGMLLSVAAAEWQGAKMPLGQAALFWLRENMPRTADRVFAEMKTRG